MEDVKLSDPDIIISLLFTQVKHDGQSSTKKNNKKEEVQNIESDEEDSASEESRLYSPAGGEGDEVNLEEEWEEGDKKGKGELYHRRIPLQRPKHQRKGRFLCRNPQQERRPVPISLSRRMHS